MKFRLRAPCYEHSQQLRELVFQSWGVEESNQHNIVPTIPTFREGFLESVVLEMSPKGQTGIIQENVMYKDMTASGECLQGSLSCL